MTLLLADGADNQFQKIFSTFGSPSWSSTGGINGNGAFFIPNNASNAVNGIRFSWASTVTGATVIPRTVHASFWMRSSVFLSSITYTNPWLDFFRTGGGFGWIDLTTQGYPAVRQSYTQSVGSGTVFTSSLNPLNLFDTRWHHVFMAVRYSDSGLFRLRIDNKVYASFTADMTTFSTGGDSMPYTMTVCNITTGTAGGVFYDDVIIYDDVNTGDNFSNFDIGPTRIFTLRPSADTAQAQSTPSIGSTRYDILRKNDANATNGVITLEPGKSDLYELDDLTATVNVRSLIFNMAFATANVATRANVRVILSANNVNVAGNTFSTQSVSINNPYMENWTTYPANVASGHKFAYVTLRDFGNSNVAWAQTSIASLQIGLENTGVP